MAVAADVCVDTRVILQCTEETLPRVLHLELLSQAMSSLARLLNDITRDVIAFSNAVTAMPLDLSFPLKDHASSEIMQASW